MQRLSVFSNREHRASLLSSCLSDNDQTKGDNTTSEDFELSQDGGLTHFQTGLRPNFSTANYEA
jgi:hypothetical protein